MIKFISKWLWVSWGCIYSLKRRFLHRYVLRKHETRIVSYFSTSIFWMLWWISHAWLKDRALGWRTELFKPMCLVGSGNYKGHFQWSVYFYERKTFLVGGQWRRRREVDESKKNGEQFKWTCSFYHKRNIQHLTFFFSASFIFLQTSHKKKKAVVFLRLALKNWIEWVCPWIQVK